MERTVAPTSPPPEVHGLLDGIPGQRTAPHAEPPPTGTTVEPPAGTVVEPPVETAAEAPVGTAEVSVGTAGEVLGEVACRRRYRIPVPFTLSYAAVLAVTSAVTAHAGPGLVHALHQGSSTDVAHLVRTPVLVLVASALWVAGGFASPFTLGFLVVLTALERRTGGVRTAVVFLLGHVLATLATEVPVGLAVLVGRLPDSSLHRLDYGISFGVAASVGALAGLLKPWLGGPLLAAFGAMLLQDLIAFTDPLTNWGHLIALAIGVGTWPWLRRLPRPLPGR